MAGTRRRRRGRSLLTMKKVVAFVGSARKRHTQYAVERFFDELRALGSVECEIVRLGEHYLGVCRGCSLCLDKGEQLCPLKDDRENRLGEKIPLITAMILLISLSACSFSRVVLKGPPIDRKADSQICRGCHERLSSFHHPVGPAAIKRCISATPTEELNCSYCHAAYTAKNHGKEKNPTFTTKNGLLVEDDLCLKCHPPDNPTCKDEYRGTASHFMGDPTRPETFGNQAPPLKTTPWPATKLPSRYGGVNGKGITCLSCHVFRKSPDATLTEPLPYHLLATAGEKYDLGRDRDDYLCTGCHGLLPAGGRYDGFHPLLSATMPSSFPIVVTPPATITENGHLNCLSCHRTHGAMPQGGYYLLKKVQGSNNDPKAIHPHINPVVLCRLCHLPYH